MDHSLRGTNSDTSNATSASSNLMPNVLFREIHKNAFLKRHSSDRRAGFPRKSERVWVVFCVHDDIEPFLEIYPDQKVALTHKPEWFASLSNVLHVSPTICGHEDEFEFAITLSFQVVRLSAPTWDSMMEWVETIRNKLRELKVLCPKENIYSKMPEQKQPLLPTRDPNSPLPLPPEGPSTLLPGVELVHLENRSNSILNSNHENGRQQWIAHSRSVDQDRRITSKRTNIPVRNESSSTEITLQSGLLNNCVDENHLEGAAASSSVLQGNKIKIKKAASSSKPIPSTSSIPVASNITVIEVSTSSFRETNGCNLSDNEDDKEFSNLVNENANEESTVVDEAHYEHVFLSNVPVPKAQFHSPQCKPVVNCVPINGNKSKKKHTTSLLMSSTNSNSSQDESLPSTSSISLSNSSKDTFNSGCINISSNSAEEIKTTDKNPLNLQIQSKLEKVSITGLIPRVPAKSSKVSSFKPPSPTFKDANLNILETNRSYESGCSFKAVEDQINISNGECSSGAAAGISGVAYSQVKKNPKGKVKSEEFKSEEKHSSQKDSPVVSKRKMPEIQILEIESYGNKKPENVSSKSPPNLQDVKVLGSRKQECGGASASKDVSRNSSADVSNSEPRNVEIASSGPSTSGNNSHINLTRKESLGGSNNNSETEPIIAVVQPPVGVISVEDIPLIGGHQRRRRRSSSSDPAPTSILSSSRGIGGADRIRINVPNNPTRETPRNDNEIRSTCHVRNATNPNPNLVLQPSRLTLREKQVLQLKKEMLHPGGVRLQLRRKDCTGSIALVDVLNKVWIAGWKQKEHPLLYNALHIGDQLISIGDVLVRNSAEAQKLIRSSTSLYIEFIIRRVPFGNVFALQRSSEGQSLGIMQEGNTAEIKDVLPNSIAARQGLTSKTPSSEGLTLTTWFLTEINGRPLNLFFKDNEVRDRLNAVGKEISILVQPHDFIKQIKKQLKNIRSYKDYIVQ